MFPGYVQQPDFIGDVAYRKGYAHGLAASDPSRMITVNVNISGAPPSTPNMPLRITFSIRQDTPMRDVVTEINRRLPVLEYPVSIATVGPDAEELTSLTDGELMEYLRPWDASFLTLRLNVKGPEPIQPPKKSTGSRLRNALGLGKGQSQTSPAHSNSVGRASSPGSMRSAPPPYEETARPMP